MKKLVVLLTLVMLATSMAGCNSCRQGLFSGGLFNRGDRCDDCPPVDCAPGMPRATMMVPGTQVMPGPIEIAPAN